MGIIVGTERHQIVDLSFYIPEHVLEGLAVKRKDVVAKFAFVEF